MLRHRLTQPLSACCLAVTPWFRDDSSAGMLPASGHHAAILSGWARQPWGSQLSLGVRTRQGGAHHQPRMITQLPYVGAHHHRHHQKVCRKKPSIVHTFGKRSPYNIHNSKRLQEASHSKKNTTYQPTNTQTNTLPLQRIMTIIVIHNSMRHSTKLMLAADYK